MNCPTCKEPMQKEPSLFTDGGWFSKPTDSTIHHCESCGHTIEKRRGAKTVTLDEGVAPLDIIFQGP